MAPTTRASAEKPFKPCNTCRLRHLKCDSQSPACANCRKSNSDCIRSYSVQFRHRLNPSVRPKRRPGGTRGYDFAENQPWVRTNRALHFVDETRDVVQINDGSVGSSDDSGDDERPPIGNDTTSSSRSPRGHRATRRESTYNTVPSQPDACVPAGSSGLKQNQSHATRRESLSSHSRTRSDFYPSPHSNHFSSGGYADTIESIYPPIPEDLSSSRHTLLESYVGRAYPILSAHQPPDEALPIDNLPQAEIDDAAHSPQSSLVYLDKPQWPLQDPEEAFLLRYFIENLAPFFDLCDTDRHFARLVPLRAAVCLPLLNAILAASAKRLGRISDFDGLAADRYHQRCLRALIPALSSTEAADDENILTAIVILRYMEELDVPISASDAQESHLIGTRVLIAAATAQQRDGEQFTSFEGLYLAAFWVALRQEIHMAFVHSRPVHPDLVPPQIAMLLGGSGGGSSSDECCDCANRIILHCAACLAFCYGGGGGDEQSVQAWDDLRRYQDEWWESRPWYFTPVWSAEAASDGLFPQQAYVSDAAVIGMVHYHLARILLAAHNPKVPRLGPGRVTATRKSNEEIKDIVRVICGIAETNPRTAPVYVNACIAITMAGDRFTEKHEQEALYSILVKTDKQLAWPTRSAQRDLRYAWGWTDADMAQMSIDIDHSPVNSVGT